ncbi:MAG: D-glycerate dehydrogenase [Desulfobacterales bacterium]|nr:D-glycerate dehydrogenase [Desulfobacterales bacterium]
MKVLVTGRLPEAVMAAIKEEHHVVAHGEDRPIKRQRLLDLVGDKEGLLCMITDRIDGEVLDGAPNLKMIANLAVGYDNIDVADATVRGIPVSNTPGVLTDATADITFALILAMARRVVEGDRRTRAGEFRFWAPLHFLGREVSGKTLGIIGLGRIGRAVARRAKGFDMQILYHSRKRLEAFEENELGVSYADFNGLLEQSDFVSLHVPLTDGTHHLIGLRELKTMKPSAYLINTSRGPVVDEEALLEVLREGGIEGAGLDVYENEPALTPGLTELKNVVLLPHVGSGTIETRTKMGLKAAENLLAGLRGKRPPDCLNPEVFS